MIRAGLLLVLWLFACSPLTSTPSPSSSAQATVTVASSTTAAATNTATSSPAATARFGLSYGPFLRTESDAEPFATLDGNVAAVSPDGWSLAYWHSELGVAETSADLRVIDLRTGSERPLMTAGGDRPGSVLWRSDGGALAVTGISTTSGQGVDPPPAFVRIRIADLTTGQTRELPRIERARFQPIAWNATTRIIVGAWLGEGGLQRVFRVRDDGTVLPDITPTERYENIVGNDDGTSLLMTYGYGESAHWYSGARVFRADSFTRTATRDLVDDVQVVGAQYRRTRGDVLALVRLATPLLTYALEIWPADLAGPAKRVWTSSPAPSGVGNASVRLDGRVAYLQTFDPNVRNGGWLRIDLETGAAATLPTNARSVPNGPSFYVTDAAIARLKPVLIAPTITRDDAVARVRGMTKNVIRVDRIDAKLTTYRDVV
ncbi:MAG TPA: hypothetical protein VEP48_07045, partial [Methylomirabilota bacterium]|nr:hypothetical protein [Methylomirabilota bacterium]